MFKFILILACFLSIGCTQEDREALRRGSPDSANYIAPDYRPCKIIKFVPEFQAYTVVEDDRKRRYAVFAEVGEEGEEFSMDVSLMKEIK